MFKIKIKRYFSWPRLLSVIGLCLLVALSIRYPLSAQSVVEGYDSDQKLQRGMIVSLNKDNAKKVELANDDNIDRWHGVVVGAGDAAVTLAADGQRVFVATTGRYEALVSTQGGNIVSGDYVTVSAISGIGMKAGAYDPLIIGRALSGFDGSKDVISSSDLKNSSTNQNVAIGRVAIDVEVTRSPLVAATEPNLPKVLRRVAETVAGKPVESTRVYVGVLVFGITSLVSGSLWYGGARSALISIGRNPLSKKSIKSGMLQVVVTGLIIFIVGVFGVYLILRL